MSSRPPRARLCDIGVRFAEPVGTARVALDQTITTVLETQTLAIFRGNPGTADLPVWQVDAQFAPRDGGGDQIKDVVVLETTADAMHLAYLAVHCPAMCFTSDIVVLGVVDGKLSEVFRTNQFTGSASIATRGPGMLAVTDSVFQPGDMCCPTGSMVTTFRWSGQHYERTP